MYDLLCRGVEQKALLMSEGPDATMKGKMACSLSFSFFITFFLASFFFTFWENSLLYMSGFPALQLIIPVLQSSARVSLHHQAWLPTTSVHVDCALLVHSQVLTVIHMWIFKSPLPCSKPPYPVPFIVHTICLIFFFFIKNFFFLHFTD